MNSYGAVHIVDDDAATRDALSRLLRQVGIGAECYPSAENFLEQFEPTSKPSCLITDMRMPGMSGLELQKRLRDRGISVPVVVLTGHGDVHAAVCAMKSGVLDFLEKPVNEQQLLDCVSRCLESHARILQEEGVQVRLQKRLDRLSDRERQVMDLIIAGCSSKEVAAQLGISPKTVDVHRANILDKLDVHSIAELIRFAMAAKLYPEHH